MVQAAVIYAPAGGEPEALARRMEEELQRRGLRVAVKEASRAQIPDLAAARLVLFGAATGGGTGGGRGAPTDGGPGGGTGPAAVAGGAVLANGAALAGGSVPAEFGELFRALAGVSLAGRLVGVVALGGSGAGGPSGAGSPGGAGGPGGPGGVLEAFAKALGDCEVALEPGQFLHLPAAGGADLPGWLGGLVEQLEAMDRERPL